MRGICQISTYYFEGPHRPIAQVSCHAVRLQQGSRHRLQNKFGTATHSMRYSITSICSDAVCVI